MSVFNSSMKDHTKSKMFLDTSGGVNVQRYDTLKYRQFDKLTDKQLGFLRPKKQILVEIVKILKTNRRTTHFYK